MPLDFGTNIINKIIDEIFKDLPEGEKIRRLLEYRSSETQNSVKESEHIEKSTSELQNLDITKESSEEEEETPQAILNLRAELKQKSDSCHRSFIDSYKTWTFVGNVDHKKTLIQQGTNLSIVDNYQWLSSVFYQYVLENFSTFEKCHFTKPYETYIEPTISPNWNGKRKSAIQFKTIPIMLKEYFAIGMEVSDNYDVVIRFLPNIFRIQPITSKINLQLLIDDLLIKVDYSSERSAFKGIIEAIARFYAKSRGLAKDGVIEKILQWKEYNPIEEIFTDGWTNVPLVNLPQLYKVFERC